MTSPLTPLAMRAVVPVRAGAVPVGGAEAVAESDGQALIVGEGTGAAADSLRHLAEHLTCVELGAYAPGRWAAALAALLSTTTRVILPASPDGRDLAPRLAAAMRRPLWAGAVEVRPDSVVLARRGGLVLEDRPLDGEVIITLQPGVRGVIASFADTVVDSREPAAPDTTATAAEAVVLAVLAPDAATMDLSEAVRIVGGGAGLDSAERFAQLAAVARAIDAATGATRVVTDRGWLAHERQIGTTGVVVNPRLYLALGISGAVQHTSGLGDPEHIISVNTDPHCPMMTMADLAVVADANAVLDALAERLGASD